MKAKATRLAGSIQHYCDRCRGRMPADHLYLVWNRIVCGDCLKPTEQR